MATLTYDPTPADQPEFNEAEQEAIARGEQAEAEQQQMLAGKFKDAEALEQAYIELQKKLGEQNDPEEAEGVQREEETAEEEVEENPNFELLNKASAEFYENNGQVSEETLEELGKLDSSELISAYIQMQGEQRQSIDLTDSQAESIKQMAGGEEGYAALTSWASDSLEPEYITAFDNIVETGDVRMIQLALQNPQYNTRKISLSKDGRLMNLKISK